MRRLSRVTAIILSAVLFAGVTFAAAAENGNSLQPSEPIGVSEQLY
ncbi:MAG: hypothetical protein ACI4GB_04025 [Acutalibacteraceae bacterium]